MKRKLTEGTECGTLVETLDLMGVSSKTISGVCLEWSGKEKICSMWQFLMWKSLVDARSRPDSPTLLIPSHTKHWCTTKLRDESFSAPFSPMTADMFADDTAVTGLIRNNESFCREEVDHLVMTTRICSLTLKKKTKELIVDFGNNVDTHSPTHINGVAVEHVSSFKSHGRCYKSLQTKCSGTAVSLLNSDPWTPSPPPTCTH